jgi:hypothetical protein
VTELLTQSMPMERPSRVTAIAALTLASGVLNLLWSAALGMGFVLLGAGTFLIGCLCLPVALYPLLLGILETTYAVKLLRRPVAYPVKPAYHIAVMEILDALVGNFPALVVGVAALIFYNDRAVRGFFGEAG